MSGGGRGHGQGDGKGAAGSAGAAGAAGKVLLHACCGPCSLESTRALADEGLGFDVFYANPNIFPPDEYERRRETLRAHVTEPQGVGLFEGDYDPEAWEREAGVHGADREARCRACYRLRLERTAAKAEELGYAAICTTLTISPYQYTRTILEELRAAARRHGLQALCRDFRDLYPATTRRSLQLGMYRQNYCGCRFSIAEAQQERRERKERHERAKAAKHLALVYAAAEGAVGQPSQL